MKQNVFLIAAAGLILAGLCEIVFGVVLPGNQKEKEDLAATSLIGRYDWERVFLADGTSLICLNGVFIIDNSDGTEGNSEDGCQFEIRNGVIDELLLLSEKKRYRVYRRKDVVNAIRYELEQGSITYREDNGLFYDRFGSLLNSTLTAHYKTLASTARPERTEIRFKNGKVWKIEEFDRNLTSHASFDMDEIIMRYTESKRLTKTYVGPEWYCGAGAPRFVTNEKIPYIEETEQDCSAPRD
jgi:hypothetical protein